MSMTVREDSHLIETELAKNKMPSDGLLRGYGEVVITWGFQPHVVGSIPAIRTLTTNVIGMR